MANQNFVVHNGLTVGQTQIFAGNGDIISGGNLTVIGNLSVTGQLVSNSSVENLSVNTLNSTGNITTTSGYFIGNGGLLTGLPAGYSNVQLASYLAGSISTGAITSTGYINTTANISTAQLNAGQINTTGNILSTGAVHNSLTVNGTATASGIVTLTNTTNNSGTNATTGALQVSGGAGIVGNLFVGGNLFVVGNTTVINEVIQSQIVGNLIVGIPLSFTATEANIQFAENQNSTTQMNIQNQSTGSNASADYVSTANNGNDLDTYIDMGINGSGYTPNAAALFGASYANDGYLYVQGNTSTGGGNLMLATMNGTNKIFLAVGGQNTGNIVATVNTTGITVTGTVQPDANNTRTLGTSGARWSTVYGVTFSGTSTTANYADVAEKYTSDAVYEPGTVLQFGGLAEVTVADIDTPRIAGVVSTNPAYLMNDLLVGENTVALALTGRVPCKVRGLVRKGDLMTSAGDGYAHANPNAKMGSVIGKALEDHDGLEGIIEVVVGRL